jgi:quercetin dioxygenase-like cupin family protein
MPLQMGMKTIVSALAVFSFGLALGIGSSEVIHAQNPTYATKQIIQTDLNNLPGQEVLLFTSTWQPGFRLPLHMHPEGHEFTFVIEGEQTFEVEGVGTKIVKAGEVIYTPPNTPHFGRNATDKPSKTLVVRIKARDKPISVEISKSPG